MTKEEMMSAFEGGTLPRADHLDLCKQRAMARWTKADYDGAFTGMMGDLAKHDALKNHGGIGLGIVLEMTGKLDQPTMLRRWITGFN